jgi:RNA 2',3'-cyclic 3'-phosphodiesterase
MEDTQRLFFGAETIAPWPKELPRGRLVEESSRHLTLAFLGTISFKSLEPHLFTIPQAPFDIGIVGISDQLLALPNRHARVIACHVKWLEHEETLRSFHRALIQWLLKANYTVQDRELLSHITIARAPFDRDEWMQLQLCLPFVLKGFHLYESVGNLSYVPLLSSHLFSISNVDALFFFRSFAGFTRRNYHSTQ